jgi:hypothetical protein
MIAEGEQKGEDRRSWHVEIALSAEHDADIFIAVFKGFVHLEART